MEEEGRGGADAVNNGPAMVGAPYSVIFLIFLSYCVASGTNLYNVGECSRKAEDFET